ncbi:hypothetical protein [Arcobacter sp. FWKO B]|uniref:hypothetical protein n=1 Tax=Arcobacter sp. FWKO B TaxID=2593672 RepID=UPI0018A5C6F1|nr:hypothetical protein [Arcobacter sp. FWKO B]QOG11222.1 hypothetical protein FWKOB_00310 [Arcobacter sp. FWKO B]
MPQLIAMIIVIVGALIYMFQTFGGTGDKIEGIAQKTSVITEINNIKTGVKMAARTGHVVVKSVENQDGMQELGKLQYFAQQINDQLKDSTDKNAYYAISFGNGTTAEPNKTMIVRLVHNRKDFIPGLFVDLSQGSLATNAGFLEAQLANDLAAIARVDRHATTAAAADGQWGTTTEVDKRIPKATDAGTNTDTDGKFIIYFTDFGSNEVVK